MSVDLFLDDKKFISVRRASKETGYSQDYIGQLCRQNKIPAKLIGRAWFVDFESLKTYKTNISSKNSKGNNINNYQEIKLPEPKTENTYIPQQYSSELVKERIPNLSEKKDVSRKIFSKSSFGTTLMTALVTIFIVSSASFSWINYFSPKLSQKIDSIIVSIYDNVQNSFTVLRNKFNLLALVGQNFSEEDQAEVDALVVFPDNQDKDKKIENIKNNFSDEVEVLFDEEGESGVIRPIFRPGEESENYAFVLVPLKEKK